MGNSASVSMGLHRHSSNRRVGLTAEGPKTDTPSLHTTSNNHHEHASPRGLVCYSFLLIGHQNMSHLQPYDLWGSVQEFKRVRPALLSMQATTWQAACMHATAMRPLVTQRALEHCRAAVGSNLSRACWIRYVSLKFQCFIRSSAGNMRFSALASPSTLIFDEFNKLMCYYSRTKFLRILDSLESIFGTKLHNL
jgi:hypothetical protein